MSRDTLARYGIPALVLACLPLAVWANIALIRWAGGSC